MEIARVVLVLAMAVAVTALMLYVFGGGPKALPYGEPMPYITFKNTTRGIILSRNVKTDSLSKGFTWIAMPGVFKGLTAGGWDVFINMAPNKIVMNSTTPPIVLNFIR